MSKEVAEENNKETFALFQEYDYLLKYMALGDSGVGKTSIYESYVNNKYLNSNTTTIGIDFYQKLIKYKPYNKEKNGRCNRIIKIALQLWDTAGSERFRSITTGIIRDAMGFIVVFDLSNRKTFDSCRYWIEQISLFAYSDKPDIILVGNKSDVINEQNVRAITNEELDEFIETYSIPYYEVSAKSSTNVNEIFEKLTDLIMDRMSESIYNDKIISINGINGHIVRPIKNNIKNNDKTLPFKPCC